jgi:hypothetical protein
MRAGSWPGVMLAVGVGPADMLVAASGLAGMLKAGGKTTRGHDGCCRQYQELDGGWWQSHRA